MCQDGVKPVIRKLIRSNVPTALFAQRECLQDLSNFWLLCIIRQIPQVSEGCCDSCLIQCGRGNDLLVLLNDATIPSDISSVPKLSVSISLGQDSKSEQSDTICPDDPLWMHVYLNVKSGAAVHDCRVYLNVEQTDSLYQDQLGQKGIVRFLLKPNSWRLEGCRLESVENPQQLFRFRGLLPGNRNVDSATTETIDRPIPSIHTKKVSAILTGPRPSPKKVPMKRERESQQ